MRQMIAALGILLVMLPGTGLMRPAVAETQNSAQKTATCTLQVEGMT
jgi:hypothetical protein